VGQSELYCKTEDMVTANKEEKSIEGLSCNVVVRHGQADSV
jgi:hypothetical protein